MKFFYTYPISSENYEIIMSDQTTTAIAGDDLLGVKLDPESRGLNELAFW
jgi:hypothetical protein